jgi:signal peptidase I
MKEKSMIQSIVRGLSNIVVLIALAWFVVHSFLSQAYVSGHSMEPALASGDLVLVDTLRYDFVKPARMDVVIFRRSDHSQNIKRIVGLPGETVLIRSGHIYINGNLLESDEISDISLAGIAENPVELMDDEYFLIGDNADSSEDSRFANIGNVKKSQMIGKVWFILTPLSRTGLVK